MLVVEVVVHTVIQEVLEVLEVVVQEQTAQTLQMQPQILAEEVAVPQVEILVLVALE
jgi:hypothetical protein